MTFETYIIYVQCADSPRAHIVTNYWNLATFTVFLQAGTLGWFVRRT